MNNIGRLILLILYKEFQEFLLINLMNGTNGLKKGAWYGKTSVVEVNVF